MNALVQTLLLQEFSKSGSNKFSILTNTIHACLLFFIYCAEGKRTARTSAKQTNRGARFVDRKEIGHRPGRRRSSKPRKGTGSWPAGRRHPRAPRPAGVAAIIHERTHPPPAAAGGGSLAENNPAGGGGGGSGGQLLVQRPSGAPMRAHACPVCPPPSNHSLRSDPIRSDPPIADACHGRSRSTFGRSMSRD